MTVPLPPALHEQLETLLSTLAGYGRVAVAFSAGVDSTVVARAAHEACGVPDGIKVDVEGRVFCTGTGGTLVWEADGMDQASPGTAIRHRISVLFGWNEIGHRETQ